MAVFGVLKMGMGFELWDPCSIYVILAVGLLFLDLLQSYASLILV